MLNFKERHSGRDYLDYKCENGNLNLNLNISSFNLAGDGRFRKQEEQKVGLDQKLKEIQRSYLNSIEESTTFYTIKTSLPRKSNVIKIIENNTEYDAKTNVK